MADPFSVDLATLVVQADSCAAQISSTPALAAAAHPADPYRAREQLLLAARRADDALTARGLAQGDVDRAARQAAALVREVARWRTRLLHHFTTIASEDERWSTDLAAVRAALGFRCLRFAGTRTALTAALPTLLGRAAALAVVCGPPSASVSLVIQLLQEASGLVEKMDAVQQAIEAASLARHTAAQDAREARSALQAELRRVEHLWEGARGGPLGETIPLLDLTWVRGAIGRRQPSVEDPPEVGS